MNKGLENTKLNEALKRKTAQFEKLQKTAYEEKNKLREQCLNSIKTVRLCFHYYSIDRVLSENALQSAQSVLSIKVHNIKLLVFFIQSEP
jgi:hypothetical protein